MCSCGIPLSQYGIVCDVDVQCGARFALGGFDVC